MLYLKEPGIPFHFSDCCLHVRVSIREVEMKEKKEEKCHGVRTSQKEKNMSERDIVLLLPSLLSGSNECLELDGRTESHSCIFIYSKTKTCERSKSAQIRGRQEQ